MKVFIVFCTVLLCYGTFFYVPDVKDYGQGVLQFSETANSFFIECRTGRKEVRALYYNFDDKMHAGLKVSYLQFDGSKKVYVTPSMRSKEQLAKILHRINMVPVWLGVVLAWCFLGFGRGSMW